MKAKKVVYERLVNRGNYENERFCVEVEVDEGDKVSEAFNLGKKSVNLQIIREFLTIKKLEAIYNEQGDDRFKMIERD